MVNAGLTPITVVDDYLANFWSQVFTDIKVHKDIAVRSGGVPEIVRDGLDGFLVSAGDISGIAGAVLKILRDEELRNRLSEFALERAGCFPVATYVQRVLRVFEETLEN
jgi:glycosyltransferase involved in cell wall biosynthesis